MRVAHHAQKYDIHCGVTRVGFQREPTNQSAATVFCAGVGSTTAISIPTPFSSITHSIFKQS